MKIAVLPGDDIGPEITDATLAVLEAADRRFDLDLGFDVVEVGMAAHRRTGTTLPPAVMARSEEHTSELQSHVNLVCRLLLEKKKNEKLRSGIARNSNCNPSIY